MLVLPHGAIKRLVETGSVNIWTPQTEPEPATNVHHVVRRRAGTQSITRARAVHVRMTILQLTTVEAWEAGFKNCDDFYEWWGQKFLSDPRVDEIECWCATYEREDLDIPQFLARPVAGRSGDYTVNPKRAIDDVEAVDASKWTEAEDLRRRRDAAQAKWLWRQERRRHGRGGQAAA